MTVNNTLRALLVVGALVGGCAGEPADVTIATTTSHLDRIVPADRPASLLVLSAAATETAAAAAITRTRLERTLATVGGDVLATLPPRLAIAHVPDGAAPLLADLDVAARFDRAVTAADLGDATLAEERFLAVHAALHFPADVEPAARLAPRYRARAADEAEGPALVAPTTTRLVGEDPEDTVAVPYASGTIVVSVVLPESNGSIDASTEDWSEALIRETHLKIQAALDRMAASDRNGDVRFVVHHASAPAAGGLPGTVDTAYEFGQRAQWGSSTEFLATADVLGHILGRTLTESETWGAAGEYIAELKRRYQADAAFFVIVAANGNYTAGLRAHAYIHGPWTVLDTGYGHETFAHEFGHIFGALDEYCPDACVPPSAVAGYLGMVNANAQAQAGSTGIDDGHGEAAPSLMIYNQVGAINGYTRAAWGWLDSDGDGVIDVRDTQPLTEVTAVVDGAEVRLTGTVVDRPASRVGSYPYSMNRIDALEYAFAAGGPWFRVALPADTRGRQAFDVVLGPIAAGDRTLYVRAVNSVGNVEGAPRPVELVVTAAGNTAPHLRLDVPARAGAASPVTVVSRVLDLEGDSAQVRYDLDGDGAWDTPYQAAGSHTFTPVAGLRTVRAEVRDAPGATRVVTAALPVLTGATPPTVTLSALPSVLHGVNPAVVTAQVTVPAGATVLASATLATDDDTVTAPVTVGADGALAVTLAAPRSLRVVPIDLTAGDRALGGHELRDLTALGDGLVAVAAGAGGLWVVDLRDRTAPRVVATLALETSANRLRKVGSLLYVLGSYLAVVDVSDPRAPRELRQRHPIAATTTASSQEEVSVSDGDGGYASHFHTTALGAPITRATVRVTVEHPRPSDLVIRLVPAKGLVAAPIVLWDHGHAPGGRRTFTFASPGTAALRALDGLLADGYWQVEVQDDVANGLAGTMVASSIELATRSRAARVGSAPAELVGVTGRGELVVAGREVVTVDTDVPVALTVLGSLAATGVQSATMVGDTAIVAAPLEAKGEDGAPVTAPVRGLCAIELSRATRPRLVRCETGLGEVAEHAQVAGRLYVRVHPRCDKGEECPPPTTTVGSAARFARGWPWQQGVTSLRVDRWAVGDATTVWTINDAGSLDQLDVADPAALVVRERFARTYAVRLVALDLPEVLLFDFSPYVRAATLGDAWSILSRVYRLTVTARAGEVATTVTRTLHLVPYDHPPAAPTVSYRPPLDRGLGVLTITVTDPDDGTTWDPVRFARIDLDSDGAFDTDWLWMGVEVGGGPASLEVTVARAGVPRTATVEVRDGFWALTRATVSIPE